MNFAYYLMDSMLVWILAAEEDAEEGKKFHTRLILDDWIKYTVMHISFEIELFQGKILRYSCPIFWVS